jgi:hypothetical protein
MRSSGGGVIDDKGRLWQKAIRPDRCSLCGRTAIGWYTLSGWDAYRVSLCDDHLESEAQPMLMGLEI